MGSSPAAASEAAGATPAPQTAAATRTSRTTVNPCFTCKSRHLKCDNQQGTCSRCIKSGIECNRGYSVRFRHTLNPSIAPKRASGESKREFKFARDQTWVQAAKSFNFVDETQEVVNIHETSDQDGSDIEMAQAPEGGASHSPPPRNLNQSAMASGTHSRPSSAPHHHNDLKIEDSASPDHSSTQQLHPRKKRALSTSASIGHNIGASATSEVAGLLTQSSSLVPPTSVPSTAAILPPNNPINSGLSPSFPPSFGGTATGDGALGNVLGDSDSLGLQLLLGVGTPNELANLIQDYPFLDNIGFQQLQQQQPPLVPPATITSAYSAAPAPVAQPVSQNQHVLSDICLDEPIWPLRDAQEASLFHYFVRELAPNFDMCDHERHFATVVPVRAPKCPPLLNALLAASAKRFSRIMPIDPLVVDKYYQNCLRTLIPALSCPAAIVNENLLAAIVILRFMEETDVPFSPMGPQSHLIGTRVFLAAQENTCDFSGLRLAAFWIALRQDVFMSFIHSRPVHPSLMIKDIPLALDVSDCDCNYANRAVLLCAGCLEYCFGDQEQSAQAWSELGKQLDRWEADRPWQLASMNPEVRDGIDDDKDDDGPFLPHRVYLSDSVVTAWQHYYLARLLLEAHNPKTPRLGPARKAAMIGINNKVKRLVRTICGIAEANPHTAPAYVPASVSIIIAGDRFTERDEQETLYRILVKTDEQMSWPTHTARSDMREVWGWSKESPANKASIAGILNRGTPIAA